MAIIGYEYRIDGGSPVDVGLPDPLVFTVEGLNPSTEYDFEVRGYDAEGNRTGWSNVATATTFGPSGLIAICGFECNINSGPHFNHAVTSDVTTQSDVVHSQTKALRIFNDGDAQITVAFDPTNAGAFPVMVVRVYVRFGTLPDADGYLLGTGALGAPDQMGLYFDQSESKLYAGINNPPSLGASGISVVEDTWYRIDIRIDRTAGDRSVDLEIDGVAAGSVATADSGGGGYLAFYSPIINAEVFYDSMYVSDVGADFPIGEGSYPE